MTEATPEAPPATRKPGRPKGLPKTGGRKSDVAKWTSDRVKDEALPHVLTLLLGVIKGDPQLVDDGLRTTADKQAGVGVWRRA